jgi:arylsulfatase A-like enzyme
MTLLKELNVFNKTTIIITSDHGEEFLEHGMFRHGYQLYEETIRVPLIIVSPRLGKDNQRVAFPVNLIDIMPTILDIFGIECSNGTDGKSLVPLLTQNKKGESFSISETAWKGTRAQSVRVGDWKCINNIRKTKKELFDLTEDPGERNNLYSQELERAKTFSRLLATAMADKHVIQENSARTGSQLQKEQLDKLRSLGYVE